jgi:hypothetical protein
MRKGLFLAGVLLVPFVTLSAASAQEERCGAFYLLEGGHYCVKCPSARPEKLYVCPGGAPGLAVAQLNHPNCNVTMYDHDCGDHMRHMKPH